jgi:hypothetical protein
MQSLEKQIVSNPKKKILSCAQVKLKTKCLAFDINQFSNRGDYIEITHSHV